MTKGNISMDSRDRQSAVVAAPQRGAGGGNAPVSAIRSYTNFRLGTLCWTNRALLYALCSPVNGRYIARAYMHAPIYKFKWPGHNAQPRHTYSNLILRFYFAWTKSTRPSWSRPDLCLNCLHGAISATIYCARLVKWNQRCDVNDKLQLNPICHVKHNNYVCLSVRSDRLPEFRNYDKLSWELFTDDSAISLIKCIWLQGSTVW